MHHYKVGERVRYYKDLAATIVKCEHPIYWVTFDDDDGETVEPVECEEWYLTPEGTT